MTPLVGGDDTIAAIATAAGRSALAMLRVSGPSARAVVQRAAPGWSAEPRVATLVELRHPDSEAVVDRAIITWYAAPRSYTGEDVIELSVHGGALAPALALDALLAAGARLALPGEFTRRAVWNGKMDVLQAEAVGDLIDARSVAMHSAAVSQLEGALSARVRALREAVLELEALIAYDIDFPEEDDGPVAPTRVEQAIASLERALDALLATAATGEMLREGAPVVLAGVPNAGKSSLFNALIGASRAIVTEIPGTTRDALEATIDIERWPVRLVDTAGLRETTDVVERLGVETSERWLAQAAVVLACGDSPDALRLAIGAAREHSDAPVIAVRTKVDLFANEHYSGTTNADIVSNSDHLVTVSAATGSGLGELSSAIAAAISGRVAAGAAGIQGGEPLLTRERHRRAIEMARREVGAFAEAWRSGSVPAVVAAVHLRAAAAALEELIGIVDVEAVLDRVFSAFCVGK